MAPRKYVVLLCDDPARAQGAQQLLEDLPVCDAVAVAADLFHLRRLLAVRIPDVIVLYPGAQSSHSMHYIKDLRKDIYVDGIPIFLYPALPDAHELTRILTRLQP